MSEENKTGLIHFGTSGWRAILADEFTFDNVRRVTAAIAQHLKASEPRSIGASETTHRQPAPTPRRSDAPIRPVIVGYDPRFLSPEFARTSAEVLSAHGIPVLLSNDVVPTPAVSYQILVQKAAGAINFTASHNPAEYNGLKFNMANGAPASAEVTHDIERLANDPSLSSSPAVVSGGSTLRLFDPRPAYLSRLNKLINFSAIKRARLKIGVDCLYGAGMGYLDEIVRRAKLPHHVLHNWRDVRFGGLSPEPGEEQLVELRQVLRREKLSIGLATDGDADRFGVVDDNGTILTPNEILPIVLQHLVKVRRLKGIVVRSVMTSHFIDAVARHYDLELKETPVGFKYIAEAMEAGSFLMGGEESGGLTIQGHVPEKDGILACLLMAEVRAIERKPFRKILSDLRKAVGPIYAHRVNLHLSAQAMQALRPRLNTYTPNTIGHLGVQKIVRLDGFKFIFNDSSWLGIRLSGTEPVVRLYLEASSPKKLKDLEKVGRHLIENPS